MADFGFDWNEEELEVEGAEGAEMTCDIGPETNSTCTETDNEAAPTANDGDIANSGISAEENRSSSGTEHADDSESATTTTTPPPPPSLLPPGVVVHRVAASEKKGTPHGSTESELLEPMIEDKAKQLEVKTLEHGEENLSPLEIFCQRSSSIFIFQRVWAAKEIGKLLECETKDVAMGVLIPIAMRLSDDRELFVRETMAQNLLPVLCYYFKNKGHTISSTESVQGAGNPVDQHQRISNDGDDGDDNDDEKPHGSSGAASEHEIVPLASVPEADDFSAWLHRLLLTPHPSVSLPAQQATVALGNKLSFDTYHTEIVHGVILGLVKNPIQQQILLQEQRSKDMIVKKRPSSSSTDGDIQKQQHDIQPPRLAASSRISSSFASLFGRRSWQSDKHIESDSSNESDSHEDGALENDTRNGLRDRSNTAPTLVDLDEMAESPNSTGFFVSPADSEARIERTRRKLLMLHMVHLVAVEFGSAMRPAVFVPVVERATHDKAFEVRRDAAAVIGSLGKAVSVDLALDVLFQCFLHLAQDPIWQVRQSAARHALPGLAVVLAVRQTDRALRQELEDLAESKRKHSLQWFAGSADAESSAESSDDVGDVSGPVAQYMFGNTPARSVPDKQWLQLVERLAGTREPSHHVRAAVFESVGKLVLALVDCTRTRDMLVSLVTSDVLKATSDQGAGRLGMFGSSASLQDLDDDSDSDDEFDSEVAATEEASLVMARAITGMPAAAVRGKAENRVAKLKAQRAVSKDVLYQCAYNMPALLAALGPAAGWERLREIYMQLSKAEHYEARRTLACSLHEVARLLAAQEGDGSQFSADLESVLCLFLIDGAEIKMAALAHLGDTLTWLTPASRLRCLPMIMQVFTHEGKLWRTRELMAKQLVKLCHLFAASVVVGSLLPQAVEWAHDPVAGVRAAVAPAFPIMFELTKLDPTTQVRFFETVISFSHADTFRGRLFFVEICSALLAHDQDPESDPVDFDQFFLPSLAALATDRVANVRIALARLVRRMLENRARRQSISATLADMLTMQQIKSTQGRVITRRRTVSRARGSDNEEEQKEVQKEVHPQHRSLEAIPRRRARRNTTPMRAHLLATMVQQLAKDTDRDVLELVKDLPGLPPETRGVSAMSQPVEEEAEEAEGVLKFPELRVTDDEAEDVVI